MQRKTVASRPIDKLCKQYAEAHQNPVNRSIQSIFVPLCIFGALGLVWAIPFPHLDFLGRYNGFVNWASFLIAFVVYYYYRLSPVLSYGMLLFVFAASAGIVGLEKLHNNQGWPDMWEICLLIFILSQLALFIGYKKEGKKVSLNRRLKFLLTGFACLLQGLYKKAGVKH